MSNVIDSCDTRLNQFIVRGVALTEVSALMNSETLPTAKNYLRIVGFASPEDLGNRLDGLWEQVLRLDDHRIPVETGHAKRSDSV